MEIVKAECTAIFAGQRMELPHLNKGDCGCWGMRRLCGPNEPKARRDDVSSYEGEKLLVVLKFGG